MDEQDYDLTVPVNRRDLIHVIEDVTLKADIRLMASIGRNLPKADIRLWYNLLGQVRVLAGILSHRLILNHAEE